MCGIAGIIRFDGQVVTSEQIQSMTDSISHRGPDGEGLWVNNNIGLGHRRLSIIDLSVSAHQPMISNDKRYIISYNGEVYNFKEIREDLIKKGYKFISNSDTEVVLYSFIEWGELCLDKFNGMFAFAIWDKHKGKLFLARDRYGIKPLYIHKTENFLVFASEIKAITASKLYDPSLDLEGLVEYLTFQNFFSDKTLYRNVEMLMPGTFAFLDGRGDFKSRVYWDFNFTGDLDISEDEAAIEVDRLFKQAVSRQLVSDVPINSYLSGGIDSGAISILASKMLNHMQTFTIGFEMSSVSGLELSFDERARAEHISYQAKTEHYEMVLKAGDMERCMDDYVRHLEEPRVGQSYPNYYAAKLASKFGKVVLSGCGGDELFGGYPWRYVYSKQDITFDSFIDLYYLKWQRLFSNEGLNELLSPIYNEIKHIDTREIFARVFEKFEHKSLSPDDCFNMSLYFEAKTFLHGLLTVEDKVSMAHSLETRIPFLDNDLVDFALTLPKSLKINKPKVVIDENDVKAKMLSDKGKIVLRKVLSNYLDESIYQFKKQGFSSPDASWFRGESIDYVEKSLKMLPEDIFNHKVTSALMAEHKLGKKNNRLAIWSLLYLENFSRNLRG